MCTVCKSAKLIVVVVNKSIDWVVLPLNEFLCTETLDKTTIWDAVANAVNFALGDNYPENIINIGLFPDSSTEYPSHEMSITSSSDVIIPLHYTKVIELPGRLEKLLVTNAATER